MHGAVSNVSNNSATRADICGMMYQEAAIRLVRLGAFSHAVSLYARDAEAIGGFFLNGFGCRCMDAIADIASLPPRDLRGVSFREAHMGDAAVLSDMFIAQARRRTDNRIYMTGGLRCFKSTT